MNSTLMRIAVVGIALVLGVAPAVAADPGGKKPNDCSVGDGCVPSESCPPKDFDDVLESCVLPHLPGVGTCAKIDDPTNTSCCKRPNQEHGNQGSRDC